MKILTSTQQIIKKKKKIVKIKNNVDLLTSQRT
jgi:hypothetical protein